MRLNISFNDKDEGLIQIEGSGQTLAECIKSATKDYNNRPITKIDIGKISNQSFHADTQSRAAR